jgi:transposase-like protein
MKTIEITKRKYFTKQRKLEILQELQTSQLTISALARKHDIHPVTVHKWKREMTSTKENHSIAISEMLAEIERLKSENDNLKKAVGELAVDNQILQAANDIFKKAQREEQLKSLKKSRKK